ncbi:ImmA/IrrE family metallo-endopeptidase [Acinetobacter wuhouensis]|uniref:ImmA/IrrE family metallo-endopeptidase n=1 Tax=Acinetobacter TaxID=469 RepID=UPI00083A42F1|nr:MULTISPECIES: ImmA/IrrE family metallo-endopeptidase [Acinetobacter]AXQ23353.1 ImmA/IrrE family metallo-endopeptidase [Acinetobacter wuhouensis]RZG87245.1 ImmA/IrrE family metallo-endopeptidase [Acinetobacter sp. WCHAc060033]
MSEYIRVNPDRIEWCRLKYDVSVELLAKKIDVKVEKLEGLLKENEDPTITYNQLEKLADLFGESILFFIKNEPIEEKEIFVPQFRTFDSQMPIIDLKIKKIIENVIAQHEVYLGLQNDLDIEVEYFQSPDLKNHSLTKQGEKIRKWLGIDNSKKMTFKDYRKLIEDKNILVFLSSGYSGAWKIPNDSTVIGFSFYNEKVPLIFIKKDNEFSDSLSVFTLFHELAHILLHKKTIIDTNEIIYSDKRIEREANLLAANILVSDNVLKQLDIKEKPEEVERFAQWLKPITDKLSVSPDVILLRLKEFNLISQFEYDSFRLYRKEEFERNRFSIVKEQKGIPRRRSLEPKQIFGDGYVRVVIEALHSKLVTLNKASNYLDGVKIKNIQEIERSIYG